MGCVTLFDCPGSKKFLKQILLLDAFSNDNQHMTLAGQPYTQATSSTYRSGICPAFYVSPPTRDTCTPRRVHHYQISAGCYRRDKCIKITSTVSK